MQKPFANLASRSRYDVRGIWVNGKLARFAAHEEAQWLKKAEFAKGKLQRGQISSRCTHFAPEAGETEAEREEQMAELQSQIDNTGPSSVSFLKHWSFSVCICQGYITWCNCRKVEHPACMLLDESCGGVGVDNVEDNLRADPSGAWDHTTSEPGVPRGSRPFCRLIERNISQREASGFVPSQRKRFCCAMSGMRCCLLTIELHGLKVMFHKMCTKRARSI